MRPAALIACALTLMLCSVRPLLGDGGFFIEDLGRSESLVASPRQEALLVSDGQTVQVALRTHFRAGPSGLAWLVPVPAKPTAVTPGREDLFRSLNELTAPQFYRVGSRGLHCGCGQAMSIESSPPLVVVESHGSAGIFDYTVLSARNPGALIGWLNDHHYRVGEQAPAVLTRYVQAGWHWLAMRVRPEATAPGGTLAPHPIVYSYPLPSDGRDPLQSGLAARLVYPLAISRVSADARTEVVLYVLARRRYACVNWSNGAIVPGEIKRRSGADGGTSYAELFAVRTRQADGRLFVTEFAGEFPEWALRDNGSLAFLPGDQGLDAGLIGRLGERPVLTRLRAVMGPEAMDRDVVLAPSTSDDRVENRFNVSAVGDGPGAGGPPAAVAMLCTGMLLMRGRSWRRPAGVAFLLAACLWLATM